MRLNFARGSGRGEEQLPVLWYGSLRITETHIPSNGRVEEQTVSTVCAKDEPSPCWRISGDVQLERPNTTLVPLLLSGFASQSVEFSAAGPDGVFAFFARFERGY